MNKVILIGRLVRDPEVRYTQGDTPLAVARYSLAVNREWVKGHNNEEQSADFFSCVAFGRAGEFAERYLRKGIKIAVVGRIQTKSYVNKDGIEVNTVEVIIREQEFVESKNASVNSENSGSAQSNNLVDSDGFMNIPDGIDEELPFN